MLCECLLEALFLANGACNLNSNFFANNSTFNEKKTICILVLPSTSLYELQFSLLQLLNILGTVFRRSVEFPVILSRNINETVIKVLSH